MILRSLIQCVCLFSSTLFFTLRLLSHDSGPRVSAGASRSNGHDYYYSVCAHDEQQQEHSLSRNKARERPLTWMKSGCGLSQMAAGLLSCLTLAALLLCGCADAISAGGAFGARQLRVWGEATCWPSWGGWLELCGCPLDAKRRAPACCMHVS